MSLVSMQRVGFINVSLNIYNRDIKYAPILILILINILFVYK